MASLWQKTLYYLGLVDEADAAVDQALDEHPGAAVEETQAVPTAPVSPGNPQVQRVDVGGRTVIPGQRVEPPTGSRRMMSADPSHAEAGVYLEGSSDPGMMRSGGSAESEVVVATTFSHAQLLADLIRDRIPVVLDLRSTEPEMVRRLVDFASGLTYSLDGTMRKVGQGVILVSPPRVTVSRDERRRLADMGLYQIADVG
ncbi:MAG: cell division protein SepF [Acidimicrobiia bacterium]|nr:cell division protein SepF [Acidimicrobiia bacterium]MDH3471734.1 cell division protein SepF [Acidimicrobiia bacterium]